MFKFYRLTLITILIINLNWNLAAQELMDNSSVEIDFLDLDLEDLMNIQITSVSKKAESLQNVASAIYVITNDDIERSSATTIHELLLQVPGYWGTQEAYNDASGNIRYSHWGEGAVGSVLYLLDGTPINELMGAEFSFRNFDIPLDEIDRIEVIKGSGGTIYGANSATGVINIFTKKADSYEGFHVKAEAASPGFGNLSIRGGGKVNEKIAISGYAKGRYTSGYNPVSELDGNPITVTKNNGTGDTTVSNRLTEDYLSNKAFSGGAKLGWDISDQTKLSFGLHYNGVQQNVYSLSYLRDKTTFTGSGLEQNDTLFNQDVFMHRITNNLRLDHLFSKNHSLFVRWSANREQDFITLSGGYSTNNRIQDFEIQDNLTLGKNNFSFGLNYRFVNFDIYDINDPTAIGYVDTQSTESLKGAFFQDKISLVDGNLNFILGLKGENYSLVNDEFYLSPMAKVSVKPNENITIWGGVTQSYTTPGFNQTNIDLNLASFPTDLYSNLVFNGAYQAAIGAGADQQTATQIATQAQQGHIESNPGYTNTAGVKNGSETKPTKFQNMELGFRATIHKAIFFETNLFYTKIDDGISASIGTPDRSPMLTRPEENADYILYGNYTRGHSRGIETIIKSRPNEKIMIELSHAFLQTYLEYKPNNDWNIPTGNNQDLTIDSNGVRLDPTVPENIVRFKIYYDFIPTWQLTFSGLYATRYNSEGEYQYEQQRYTPILGGEGTSVSKNSDRTILNAKIQKSFMENTLKLYVFANDFLNNNRIERTNALGPVPLFQTHAMYGIGVKYNF